MSEFFSEIVSSSIVSNLGNFIKVNHVIELIAGNGKEYQQNT